LIRFERLTGLCIGWIVCVVVACEVFSSGLCIASIVCVVIAFEVFSPGVVSLLKTASDVLGGVIR
jgi:ferredoxin